MEKQKEVTGCLPVVGSMASHPVARQRAELATETPTLLFGEVGGSAQTRCESCAALTPPHPPAPPSRGHSSVIAARFTDFAREWLEESSSFSYLALPPLRRTPFMLFFRPLFCPPSQEGGS